MRMSPLSLHKQVLALHRAGVEQEAIANDLGLHPSTVSAWVQARRYAAAGVRRYRRH